MTGGRGAPPDGRALVWGSSSLVPPGTRWLTPGEQEVLSGLRLPKRRRDWRLGRWVAKEAVLRLLGTPSLGPRDVEVLPSPGGAPVARVSKSGAWPPVALSLSHARGAGLAVAATGSVRVGCDVEVVERRSSAFLRDYLTDGERAWVSSAPAGRHERVALVWSAKESALKVLGEGLRLDTRTVRVRVPAVPPREAAVARPLPAAGGWRPLWVEVVGGEALPGWWTHAGDFVWTVLATRPLPAPERPAPRLSPLPEPVPAGAD